MFATFTAPSFGPVPVPSASTPVRARTTAAASPKPCHPRRDAGTCPHGRPFRACYRRHTAADPCLGEPLCPECYDYPAHAVWNAAAGELWRRTKQDIERHLIALARHRAASGEIELPPLAENQEPLRLSHGKAAEYQARGAVHFHAPLRLDGADCEDPDAIVTPPPGITAADLEDAVRQAAASISFRTRSHPDSPDGQGWLIASGENNWTSAPSAIAPPSPTAVASYLAKYATKGTEPAGHASARITPDSLLRTRTRPEPTPNGSSAPAGTSAAPKAGCAARPSTAPCVGGSTCSASAGTSSPKPAATPSPSPPCARPASPTAATTTPDPTTPPSTGKSKPTPNPAAIIVRLSYAGTGWRTFGDALLANTAADQARKRRQTAREETTTAPVSHEMPKAA